MTILQSMAIAFAMYSKIPMPKVEWNEKNMKYAICFFPMVGAVIGLCTAGWWKLSGILHLGTVAYSLLGALIPLLLTGGIHIDGYMDTMDAIHSYGSREQKLSILKDPHIGAFAVITLLMYYLAYVGMYSEIAKEQALLVLALGFVLSRILSGLALVWFPAAKKEGLLYEFSSKAHKKAVRIVLSVSLLICLAAMAYVYPIGALGAAMGNGLLFCYYYRKSKLELGGITGDLAGWFLCLSELMTLFCLWILGRL